MSIMREMPMCDFRDIKTVEAVKSIEKIEEVGILIIPKDGDPELIAAITAIPKEEIGLTLSLSEKDHLSMLNGVSVITDQDFDADGNTTLIANGYVIMTDVSRETKGQIMVNGMLIMNKAQRERCNLRFLAMNGQRIETEFDQYKVLSGKEVEITPQLLSYIESDLLLIAQNCVVFSQDITVAQLQKTPVKFIVGNSIVCSDQLKDYLSLTATVLNKILSFEEYEKVKHTRNHTTDINEEK